MGHTGAVTHANLLGDPPPTYLPDDTEVRDALASGTAPAEVAARWPALSAGWAALAAEARGRGEYVASYAYARTGYHRGLDGLRRSGWKGHGPIPFSHEPNRGFLRSLYSLAEAAARIGEQDEAQRCRALLLDSDPAAEDQLRAEPA